MRECSPSAVIRPNISPSWGMVWRARAETWANTSRTSRLCARTLRSGPRVSWVGLAVISIDILTSLSTSAHFCSAFHTRSEPRRADTGRGHASEHATAQPLAETGQRDERLAYGVQERARAETSRRRP